VKEEIENIKQLIADGACTEAIDLIATLPESGGMEDELVLLQNRLKHLNRAVASGAIARDDENVERNSITRALLDLVIALETRATGSTKPKPRRQRPPEQNAGKGRGQDC
jgi:hypothetical protein